MDEHRPQGYGSKTKHPMYVIWKAAKQTGRLCSDWKEDFWRFVGEAGPRPDMKHSLYRLEEDKPFGPGNAVWRARIATRQEGESDKDYYARAQRIRRKLLPEETRARTLRIKYGITPEQYQAMHDERGGKCDICGSTERTRTNRQQARDVLCVDHDHKTGRIRGLLCSSCNCAIGYMEDCPDRMKRAIAYIEKHSS